MRAIADRTDQSLAQRLARACSPSELEDLARALDLLERVVDVPAAGEKDD